MSSHFLLVVCFQEPGNNSEILNGLRYVRPGNDYVPRFSLTQKYDVNGKNEHPLYTYLKVKYGVQFYLGTDTDTEDILNTCNNLNSVL